MIYSSPYMINLLDRRQDVNYAKKMLISSWFLGFFFAHSTYLFSSYFFIFSSSLTWNFIEFIANTHENHVMTNCHQEPKPTQMILTLVDSFITYPYGVLGDVLVIVNGLFSYQIFLFQIRHKTLKQYYLYEAHS